MHQIFNIIYKLYKAQTMNNTSCFKYTFWIFISHFIPGIMITTVLWKYDNIMNLREYTIFCCLTISGFSAEKQTGSRTKWVFKNRKYNEVTGCGDGVIRGVNLGGWLLLEPWITPVFFEAVNVGDLQDKVVDEWTYAELLEPDVYRNRMLGHWSTFVVRSHFQELATAGISHVR